MSTPKLRCAVYTRKSTDEGLDQEFNSLDAQREACTAFIASQIGLGWRLVPDHFDDGGISGGTLERPALQRLLQQIRDRKVDIVVVYKIDRLTRSLMDFSKIVEVFDANGVSFVSVTQQFNTTTSMGRLTLNVLLSFAQFEREVTAERIRDKIAASKKKGMWMGGVVPLGYRVEDRKLLIDQTEVATVRWLFDRYLELRSVRALVEEAKAKGLVGRASRRSDGKVKVTHPFGRGNLYHLLSNPIYVGRIRHRDQIYHGEHQAIISIDLFEQVQQVLANQAPARQRPTNQSEPHLLTGILFDEAGERLTPVHANKKGTRYRYYVSRQLADARRNGADGWRLAAHELESLVEHQLNRILRDRAQLADWIREWATPANTLLALDRADELAARYGAGDPRSRRSMLQRIIRKVELKTGSFTLHVDRHAIATLLLDHQIEPSDDQDRALTRIDCPFTMRRRGVETRLVLTNGHPQRRAPDPALVDLILRSHRYLQQLTDGRDRSLTDIATANGVELSEVSRILPLAFLSPKLIDAILTGSHPVQLTAQRLSRLSDLPNCWSAQEAVLTA